MLKQLGDNMALIGNKSLLIRLPLRQLGGAAVFGLAPLLSPAGTARNRLYTFSANAATPNGYLSPVAWVLPRTSGGMSSYNQASLTIARQTATLVNAQYRTGSGTITLSQTNANLGQIFAAVAAGTITLAQAVANLSALVSASASSSISILNVNGTLGGTFSMSGASTITTSPNALLTAKAFMQASAGGPTALSPEGLANAVWAKLAADANVVGTMGEKLNDAGSASNPWTEIIEGSRTAQEVLRILLAVAAGRTTVTDLGGGSAEVVFRDQANTKNRVFANLTGSQRTSVTLDPS